MDNKKRTAIQSLALIIQNANVKGFLKGDIYKGNIKSICVPGLNCYSCPGALGSCPIGALQNSMTAYKFKFPFYVLGLLLFFGAVMGRIVCGFLCPFGFIQDLLHKIPLPKKIKTFPGDKILRKVKYAVLIITVIILPLLVKLTPVFCKYLCPSGTLAGIILSLGDTALFKMMGSRFAWKACILGMIILLSALIYRPFCKYLCPLGALYAPFNRVAAVKMEVDTGKCISCSACKSVCPMGVDPHFDPNSAECIRCGKCMEKCPADALKYTGLLSREKKDAKQ